MLAPRTLFAAFLLALPAASRGEPPAVRVPDAVAWNATLDLVPAGAVSLVAMPDPKSAANDLGECLASLGDEAAALPIRPIDLFKSRLGLGGGIDEAAPFVMWFELQDKAPVPGMSVPVTEAKEFLEGNFRAKETSEGKVWEHPELGSLHARVLERRVILSTSRAVVEAYEPAKGRADALKLRLGEEGFRVLTQGEVGAWAGPEALALTRRQAQEAREAAMRTRAEAGSPSPPPPPDPSEGLLDGVLSLDFDPLGVSVRTCGIVDPASRLGGVTRGGAGGGTPRLDHLPAGNFILAASVDLDGARAVEAMDEIVAMMPGPQMVPEWVRQNRQLLSRVELGIYPSKLGVTGGGLLNDSCLWLGTSDSAKARGLLKDWMTGLAGSRDGVETKVTWEEGRKTKDGLEADAWSVSEQVVPGGKARLDPMRRMMQSMVFGPRGAMGFVKSFPEGVLVTFSQRPDVLKRCVDAAEGRQRLEGNATIVALRRWLLPEADMEAYLGFGAMLGAARQLAASFPGGGLELPDAPPGLEPIAFATRMRDGRVETAAMVPSRVIGVMVELYRIRTRPAEDESEEDGAEQDEPAP